MDHWAGVLTLLTLSLVPCPATSEPVVLRHHEAWDGRAFSEHAANFIIRISPQFVVGREKLVIFTGFVVIPIVSFCQIYWFPQTWYLDITIVCHES